jgi:hypothetical protein
MVPGMSNRAVALLCLVALLTSQVAFAQTFDPAEIKLFKALHRQPTDLARYSYLEKALPHISPRNRVVALQLLSSAESELGLYNQAVLSFPLKVTTPQDIVLPTAAGWRATDAVDAVAKLAADRHIVMINEAHHDAFTRVLTLELLPRLRALGFTYFAAEALVDSDPGLEHRGYPTRASGTEYLHEPIYGEIVREAIRLGFTIVPYDIEDNVPTQAREIGQAENLYRKVFAKDPQARLFVHAGYAHIDKAKGRLGNIQPMAVRLKSMTGFDPLSIDQTQFLEVFGDHSDDYHQLVDRFQPKTPTVLVNRTSGKVWSARPELYDVNVILPPSVNLKSFGNSITVNGETVKSTSDTSRLGFGSLTSIDSMVRPKWLVLGGTRIPTPISTILCKSRLPCLIEAQYADEPDQAIAADRYAFMKSDAVSELYLFPGRYRLRSTDTRGKTLNERLITVEGPRKGKPATR